MSQFGSSLYGIVPGLTAAILTYENVFRWGREGLGIIAGAQLDASCQDAGNSPVTTLRQGLVLALKTSTGNLVAYSPNATDGSQVALCVLLEGRRMTDLDANTRAMFATVLFGGPCKQANLIGLDTQARAQMSPRFLFDDIEAGVNPNMFGWVQILPKLVNYTVVNDTDNNTIFTTTGAAGSVTFTLPTTIKKGQKWRFCNTVAQTMTITAPAGKFVLLNNAAATSLAFSTGGQQIGANVEVWADETGSKYLAANISAGVCAGTVS